MDKMATIERQLAELDPNESADDLWAFTIQCHIVGFAVGATVATVICWFAF